jgi:hypothetical protein
MTIVIELMPNFSSSAESKSFSGICLMVVKLTVGYLSFNSR